MTTYADKLCDALAWRLPDAVAVSHSQGSLIFEQGSARVATSVPTAPDRRKPPDDATVARVLSMARSRAAANLRAYRDAFKPDGRALLDALTDATAAGRCPREADHEPVDEREAPRATVRAADLRAAERVLNSTRASAGDYYAALKDLVAHGAWDR